MSQTHLHFDMHIGRQKPENIRNRRRLVPSAFRMSWTVFWSKEEK